MYGCNSGDKAGALRGYKDMRSIFNITFVAYWLLGLPIGYVLGMKDWIVEPMGAHGFGLVSSLVLRQQPLCWVCAYTGCTNKMTMFS